MDKEKLFKTMDIIKANINKVKKKEMDLSSSIVEIYIKVYGIKINSTD